MRLSPEILTILLDAQNRPQAPVAAAQTAAPTDKAADAREWHNKAVTIEFGAKVFYRVDGGAWQEGLRASIDGVGIHRIATKPTAGAAHAQSREIGIDLTPPSVVLRARPGLGQEAGVYSAGPDTLFTIEAKDDLSGVRSIEVSIDGAGYRPYAGAFRLKPGTHSVGCRVTDRAGNQEETMAGSDLSGGPTRNATIVVRVP
jgi:hypothetical protein